MTITTIDKAELEKCLAEQYGSKLRTGKPKENVASSYLWDKREKFLHQNMKRQNLQANTGGR